MPAIDSLDPDRIQAKLGTTRAGTDVIVYDRTASTNDIAFEYAKNPANNGLAIFAEEQTAGRGRGGNRWESTWGRSILCSVVLGESQLSCDLLSLASAVATAEAIDATARIKWPNDVFLNGKKVAGLLLEGRTQASATTCVLGIGINCHQKYEDFGPRLQGIATSVDMELGGCCDRTALSRRLLISIDYWLDKAATDAKAVGSRWRDLSVQLGHRISLSYNGRAFTGHCIGADPDEGLILRLDTGGVRMFPAAQSSIVTEPAAGTTREAAS